MGHIGRDCPRHVLVTFDDEVDEEALYEADMLYDDNTCMMTRCVSARPALCDRVSNAIDVEPDRSRVRAYVHDRVLFSPTEVIFDTAASRSVFENSELLCDVAKSDTPTMIGGVQKGVVGIRIDDEGTFRDLGTVGIATGAVGNILSACQMVDGWASVSNVVTHCPSAKLAPFASRRCLTSRGQAIPQILLLVFTR